MSDEWILVKENRAERVSPKPAGEPKPGVAPKSAPNPKSKPPVAPKPKTVGSHANGPHLPSQSRPASQPRSQPSAPDRHDSFEARFPPLDWEWDWESDPHRAGDWLGAGPEHTHARSTSDPGPNLGLGLQLEPKSPTPAGSHRARHSDDGWQAGTRVAADPLPDTPVVRHLSEVSGVSGATSGSGASALLSVEAYATAAPIHAYPPPPAQGRPSPLTVPQAPVTQPSTSPVSPMTVPPPPAPGYPPRQPLRKTHRSSLPPPPPPPPAHALAGMFPRPALRLTTPPAPASPRLTTALLPSPQAVSPSPASVSTPGQALTAKGSGRDPHTPSPTAEDAPEILLHTPRRKSTGPGTYTAWMRHTSAGSIGSVGSEVQPSPPPPTPTAEGPPPPVFGALESVAQLSVAPPFAFGPHPAAHAHAHAPAHPPAHTYMPHMSLADMHLPTYAQPSPTEKDDAPVGDLVAGFEALTFASTTPESGGRSPCSPHSQRSPAPASPARRPAPGLMLDPYAPTAAPDTLGSPIPSPTFRITPPQSAVPPGLSELSPPHPTTPNLHPLPVGSAAVSTWGSPGLAIGDARAHSQEHSPPRSSPLAPSPRFAIGTSGLGDASPRFVLGDASPTSGASPSPSPMLVPPSTPLAPLATYRSASFPSPSPSPGGSARPSIARPASATPSPSPFERSPTSPYFGPPGFQYGVPSGLQPALSPLPARHSRPMVDVNNPSPGLSPYSPAPDSPPLRPVPLPRTWRCSVCTLSNTATACDACGAAAPQWSCARCTLHNEHHVAECGACGATKEHFSRPVSPLVAGSPFGSAGERGSVGSQVSAMSPLSPLSPVVRTGREGKTGGGEVIEGVGLGFGRIGDTGSDGQRSPASRSPAPRSPVPPSPSGAAHGSWMCPRCTYGNEPGDKCTMCETPRP